MWNGKLCTGDLQGSLYIGEITTGIAQTFMSQITRGTNEV